jgi:hypothetical protein
VWEAGSIHVLNESNSTDIFCNQNSRLGLPPVILRKSLSYCRISIKNLTRLPSVARFSKLKRYVHRTFRLAMTCFEWLIHVLSCLDWRFLCGSDWSTRTTNSTCNHYGSVRSQWSGSESTTAASVSNTSVNVYLVWRPPGLLGNAC